MHPPGTHQGSALRCIAVIPARYFSTRFPGKALADLDGRPMIEHVYRRAAASRAVDRVIVATDDPRIADAVARFGGEAQLTSPHHLTGTDRLAEIADDLDCDLVVNVQGDEPLLDPRMIDEAVAPFRADATLMMSTLRRRIEDEAELLSPDVVKVVVDREGYALYFSRAFLPYVRDAGRGFTERDDFSRPDGRRGAGDPGGGGDDSTGNHSRLPVAYKHIGLYVYRREFLLAFARLAPTPLEQAEALEQLRALEHGFRIRTVETAFDSVGVDTPEDLERVRRQTAAAART